MLGLIYALIAAGLNLIWGMMEIVNFSHGECMMINMYVAYFAFTLFGISPLLSLPLCFLISFLLGCLIYQILIKRILKNPMLVQVVVTFGLSMVLRSSAQILWSPDFRTISDPIIKGVIDLGGIYLPKAQFITGMICFISFGLLYILMTKTKLGSALQATAEDREIAVLMGINSNRMFSIAWGIGIGAVGIAGGLLSSFYYIFPDVGSEFALIAYVVVALGGFGSVFGTLLAGVIIGIIEMLGGYLFVSSLKYALIFFVYLIITLTRPQGLFGKY